MSVDEVKAATSAAIANAPGDQEHSIALFGGLCENIARIADALTNPHSIGGNIEDIAYNAGRAFENGRRQ